MALTHVATLAITQSDASGTQVLTRTVGPVTSTVAVAGGWLFGVLTSTAPVTVTLPTSVVRQLYLKNLHTSDPLTATWTPQAGTSGIVSNLYPSAWIAQWTTSTGSGAGITTLALLSSSTGGSVGYEMFLGG